MCYGAVLLVPDLILLPSLMVVSTPTRANVALLNKLVCSSSSVS